MSKNKPVKLVSITTVIVVICLLLYVFVFRTSSAAINDECFAWKFPKDVKIERYDRCSSLSLIKITDGREVKANFVLSGPIMDGRKDYFFGKPEVVTVSGGKITRYLNDNRDSNSGLGSYHGDYSINYDRIPLKTQKSGGRTLLTAEFVLASKNNTHASDQEVNDFIKLTDSVMNALHTK